MSYVTNISDVTYNHSLLKCDARVRDLYVDRNYFGPSIVGPPGPPGPTGATGAPGPPGPPGPSFTTQGWSAQLSADLTIASSNTQIPFDQTSPSLGGYNTGGWFNTSNGIGLIQEAGIYIVSCMVDYEHNGFPPDESVTATIKRNGPSGQIVARNTIWYAAGSNDIETIVCTNTVSLLSGDTLECFLDCPYSGGLNQVIGGLSRFSCQRIA